MSTNGTSTQSIAWQYTSPCIHLNQDRDVDVVIAIDGPAIWKSSFAEPEPPSDPLDVNGLKRIILRFRLPPYVALTPLSLMAFDDPYWLLPDIGWSDRMLIAFRCSLDLNNMPDHRETVVLARMRINLDAIAGDGADAQQFIYRSTLALPVHSSAKQRRNIGCATAANLVRELIGAQPKVERPHKYRQ